MKIKQLIVALALSIVLPSTLFAAPPLAAKPEPAAEVLQSNAWLEIDADAFEHNIKEVQKKLTGNTQMCVIMKADAYGSGINMLMPTVLKLNIPCIAVTSNEEIRVVRENGFTGRLMRVRAATPEEIQGALHHNVEELIGNAEVAKQVATVAQKAGKPLPVHIALNSSGMTRNGIDLAIESNKQDAVAIVTNPHLQVVGIMTHYPVGEKEAVLKALAQFKSESAWLIKAGKLDRSKVALHTANTFATMEVPETHLDIVRPGRVLYGDMGPDTAFKPVICALKTRVAAVNPYPKGSPVGYDGTHILTRDSLLANIPVGYSDGYPRALSNQGHVVINGERAPIVGSIAMNTFMVDVTDLKAAPQPGDEVTLYGKQGSAAITQAELEEHLNTFLATWYTVWAHSNYKSLKK